MQVSCERFCTLLVIGGLPKVILQLQLLLEVVRAPMMICSVLAMLLFCSVMALLNWNIVMSQQRFMAVMLVVLGMLFLSGLIVVLSFWGGPTKPRLKFESCWPG